MSQQLLDNIKIYYGETLQSNADLKTDACCTADDLPPRLRKLLADVHPEVSNRYYGCGLVAPDLLDGLRILDLGSGSGRDAYLLSRLVGEHGRVIGVDMTPEQLEVARAHVDYHRERYGYREANVEFHEGRIEALDQLGLEPNSLDVIVSNCVINLSPNKAAVLEQAYELLRDGGELYFSDVYADRRLPAELMEDPVLHGECLAGALYWNDFLQLARSAGFSDPRMITSRTLAVDDPDISERLGAARFYSTTYRLFRVKGLDMACEDYGQAVSYRGTLEDHPDAWSLDKAHLFVRDKVTPVCRNTYLMLKESRFGPHFNFHGLGERHLGPFDGCASATPLDIDDSPATSEASTACC